MDGEGLKTHGQRRCAKLLLPLGEVAASDGWDSVALLLLVQVVGVGGRVQTHHLGLERQNVRGDERSLKVELRDDVVFLEELGLVNIAFAQLGAYQELLSLAYGCDPIGVLGLMLGVDNQVKHFLWAIQCGGVQSDNERDFATLP